MDSDAWWPAWKLLHDANQIKVDRPPPNVKTPPLKDQDPLADPENLDQTSWHPWLWGACQVPPPLHAQIHWWIWKDSCEDDLQI